MKVAAVTRLEALIAVLSLLASDRVLQGQGCDPRWSGVDQWQGTFTIAVSCNTVGSDGTSLVISDSCKAFFELLDSDQFTGGFEAWPTTMNGTAHVSETQILSCDVDPYNGFTDSTIGSETISNNEGALWIYTNSCTYALAFSPQICLESTGSACGIPPYDGGPNCYTALESLCFQANTALPAFGQPLTGSITISCSSPPYTFGLYDADSTPVAVTFSWTIIYPQVQGGAVLNVERFSQGSNSPWANDYYANSSQTIQQKGCALTSLAMALNYEGVPIDPGLLNSLMIADKDFTPEYDVEWGKATQDASHDKLVFHAQRTIDLNYLTQVLGEGHPIIVGVKLDSDGIPHHYVLVTGEQNGRFLINDPGYADYTYLDQYGQFETRGYVGTPGYVGDPIVSAAGFYVSADNGEATELLVTAPSGLPTGWDYSANDVVEEIPQSVYFSDGLEDDTTGQFDTNIAHQVLIYQPLDGDYTLLVSGTNGAAYDIETSTFSQSGQPQVQRSWSGVIGAGGTITTSASVASTAPAFGYLAGLITNGAFQLIFTGTAGTTNVVETSIDLRTWNPLVSLTNTNGFLQYQDASTPAPNQKYYRVRVTGQ